MPREKANLLSIFFTVFLDFLGFGIVIPVLAPIIFDPNTAIFPVYWSDAHKTLLLGFLIATYPLAQFFAAPILGGLSDRLGRKKVLLLSLIGTFVGYLIFGFGVMWNNLVLLFVSRLIDGATGGNLAIVLSAISDISDEKTKTSNFGFVGMAFGLGFILGPYFGGKLSDPTIVSWFNYAVPFWFSALLCAVNIFLVALFFKETLKIRLNSELSIFTGFHNIRKAFELTNLRSIFIVTFLLTFGFNFFVQFFQVYLITRFHFNQSQIGDVFAYVGLCIAVTQGFATSVFSKKFNPYQVLAFSSFFLSLVLPLLLLPSKPFYLFVILPFIALFEGLIPPNATTIVSILAGDESQGEILGISQSIQALAIALPPIISGFVTIIHVGLPTILASLSIFVAWAIFVRSTKASRKKAIVEVEDMYEKL